jgi:hypothetical protein
MKLLLLILPMLLFVNSLFAKGFLNQNASWKPVPIDIKITKDLTIHGYYLKKGTLAPIAGLLLKKDDFNNVNTKLFVCNKDLLKSIKEQRDICNSLIKKCNEDSYKLNESLITQNIVLKKKFKLIEKQNKDLKFNTNIILFTSGTFITLLTASLVYASL